MKAKITIGRTLMNAPLTVTSLQLQLYAVNGQGRSSDREPETCLADHESGGPDVSLTRYSSPCRRTFGEFGDLLDMLHRSMSASRLRKEGKMRVVIIFNRHQSLIHIGF